MDRGFGQGFHAEVSSVAGIGWWLMGGKGGRQVDDLVLVAWWNLGWAVIERAYRDAAGRSGAKAAREAGLPPGVDLAGDGRSFLEGEGARWLLITMGLEEWLLDRLLAELARESNGPVVWKDEMSGWKGGGGVQERDLVRADNLSRNVSGRKLTR